MPDPRRILDEAIRRRVFPGAVADVGGSGGSVWRDAAGTLTFGGTERTRLDTPFDLASLTKVMATTSLVMDLVEHGALDLAEPVSASVQEWTGSDRAAVTVRDLLEHASGLPARLLDAPPASRREFEHDISATPLEYPPRTRSIYSDLGFVLLGFAIEDRGRAPLADQFAAFWRRLGGDASDLTFSLDADARRRAAPTLPLEDDARRGRVLTGEVHDNYAAALGGAAGHAGLFGSAGSVAAFARAVLRAARGDAASPPPFTPGRVREFTTRSAVPGSSRALGWDTMLPTSSCGTRMSASAIGHVGYTGTSLWIDPQRDRYYVLLTNRVCGGGSPDEMRDVRRAFHDAVSDAEM